MPQVGFLGTLGERPYRLGGQITWCVCGGGWGENSSQAANRKMALRSEKCWFDPSPLGFTTSGSLPLLTTAEAAAAGSGPRPCQPLELTIASKSDSGMIKGRFVVSLTVQVSSRPSWLPGTSLALAWGSRERGGGAGCGAGEPGPWWEGRGPAVEVMGQLQCALFVFIDSSFNRHQSHTQVPT